MNGISKYEDEDQIYLNILKQQLWKTHMKFNVSKFHKAALAWEVWEACERCFGIFTASECKKFKQIQLQQVGFMCPHHLSWCVHTARHRHRDRYNHYRTQWEYVMVSVSVQYDTSTQFYTTHFLSVSVSVSVSGSVNSPLSVPTTQHEFIEWLTFMGTCHLSKFWSKKSKAITKVTLQEPAISQFMNENCE